MRISTSLRALLPVRAGRDIRDAHKSPQEIDCVKVLAYVTALHRPLHECAKRFMDLAVERLERPNASTATWAAL
jgi:hypothetical protein